MGNGEELRECCSVDANGRDGVIGLATVKMLVFDCCGVLAMAHLLWHQGLMSAAQAHCFVVTNVSSDYCPS